MGLFGSAKKDASRAPPPSLGLGLQLASGSATAAAAALSNGERRIAPSSSASSAHGSFDSGYSRIDAPASLRSANGVAGQEAWRASTPSKKKEKTSKKAKARQMEDYLRQQQLEQFFNAPKQPPRPSDRLELSNLREGSDDEGKGSRTHIARFSINGMLALVESKMAFEEEQGMRSRERRRPAAPNVEPVSRAICCALQLKLTEVSPYPCSGSCIHPISVPSQPTEYTKRHRVAGRRAGTSVQSPQKRNRCLCKYHVRLCRLTPCP